ncbi:MAG: retron St85 family RNA-directed DNA polymerase [Armatimonadota bacterium]
MGFLDKLLKVFDKGRDADELSRRLGITFDDIASVTPKYSTFEILKRGGGTRKILSPDSRLKKVQRVILHRLLGRLPVHSSATGFKKKSSIVTNTVPHINKEVIVRMDIKDFFGSTPSERVEKYFKKIGWNKKVSRILTHICTYNGGLPQGAPTSPVLSNLVNFRLDARFSKLAEKFKASYTRYADDITFSFTEDNSVKVRMLIQYVKSILKNEGYTLHQKKKLHIRRKHQRQIVTGLVVNKKPSLPRKTRRWLRAVLNNHSKNKNCTLSPKQIEGWRSFSEMIKKETKWI